MSTKKALFWVGFWISLALLFNAGVYIYGGPVLALEFLGGYVIELSLSLDNLFVFLLVFGSFGIPPRYQRRVLTYGIAGAVILRLLFIVLGVAVVGRFRWVLYLFGLILIFSAAKMFTGEEKEKDFTQSKALRYFRKIVPLTNCLEGDQFFVRRDGLLYATPLLAILTVIETSDIIFAIDSIPAIFSITTTWWIIYSSNIFAILGLRNIYFILEKLHRSFCFMKYGVAVVLAFTGIKLTVLFFHIEIPLGISLLIIFGILALSILVSAVFKEKGETADLSR